MDSSHKESSQDQDEMVDYFDLDSINSSLIPTDLISENLMQQHRMVPLFHKGNRLHVATDDARQHDALKDIQFHTGFNITPVIVESHKLNKLIRYILQQKENQRLTKYVVESDNCNKPPTNYHNHTDKDDEPVVRFVRRILMEAIAQEASDIHFEAYNNNYRIRYRKDGLLMFAATPPHELSTRIAARLKIMANLDISERRIPQDGRFKLDHSENKSIDFRVSTCPTINGEKIVLRILDTQLTAPDINSLGFLPEQQSTFLHAIQRHQGLVLVTGPTGSGKTMTLYSALGILNTIDKNVSCAEDPVEISVPGINQVNINPKSGLTFAKTLRAFLRQDPDVIMVGEMRDLETAEIAIKAAQTGHLVLSTLHTNNAAETLTRLINMGIQAFNIASSVSLIVAQRLVRRLCCSCKLICTNITAEHLKKLGLLRTNEAPPIIYVANGCNLCINGYRGRIGVFEVLPITIEISNLMLSGKYSQDILKQAQRDGMLTLYQAGIEQVRLGVTSLEEINRMMVD